MTKTSTPDFTADNDLDDLTEEVQPEPIKQLEPVWNGRYTRIKLAHPVLRGNAKHPAGRFLDSTTPCLDCQQPGHAFHVASSKGSDGKWRGPEADHIRLLEEGGWLRGTRQARERADRQRRRDELVGVENASRVNTAADFAELWRYEMRDGVVNLEIERQIKRDEAAAVASGLAVAIEPLVEAIRGKLAAAPESK